MKGGVDNAYSLDELGEVPVDDGLDDLAVDVSQPDAQVGAHDQQASQHHQVDGLLGVPRGHCDLHQLFDARQEDLVHVSFAALNDDN